MSWEDIAISSVWATANSTKETTTMTLLSWARPVSSTFQRTPTKTRDGDRLRCTKHFWVPVVRQGRPILIWNTVILPAKNKRTPLWKEVAKWNTRTRSWSRWVTSDCTSVSVPVTETAVGHSRNHRLLIGWLSLLQGDCGSNSWHADTDKIWIFMCYNCFSVSHHCY